MNISKLINPFGGVSQQPAPSRLDTQCELQENFACGVIDGMWKRNSTEYIAKLTSNATAASFTHPIDIDIDEKYVMIINNDSENPIEIFNINGTQCDIRWGHLSYAGAFTEDADVKGYFNGTSPYSDYKAVTVADYTLITNTTTIPAMSGSPTAAQAPTALIYVKDGYASATYEVFVNPGPTPVATATFDTGATDQDKAKTTYICNDLYNDLVSSIGTTFNVLRETNSNIIALSKKDNSDFTIKVNDSKGNTALKAIKGKIQNEEGLPPTGVPNGIVVEITGDALNPYDGYYKKYDNGGGYYTGGWVECGKPGIDNSFNIATMPHRVVKTGVNEFTVADCIWSSRTVGDAITAPEPSFIGKPINDIMRFKGRLCFLAGEYLVMSRVTDNFNFWPKRADTALDTDPIDILVSTNQVSTLRNAIPFQSSVLIFSDLQQFIVGSGDQPLSPSTISVTPSTKFEAAKVKPVACGPDVYFIQESGNFSSVRQYSVMPNTHVNDAPDVSIHVPRYIPSDIVALTAAPSKDSIFCLSSLEPTALYCHRFAWAGDQKLQSAWYKFTFTDEVLGVVSMGKYLYIVTKCTIPSATPTSEILLCKINLEKVFTGSLSFSVCLDKLVELTGVYNSTTRKTTWTLPYSDAAAVESFTVVNSQNGTRILGVSKPTNTTLCANGNFTGTTHYIGKTYTAKYKLSEWYAKDAKENVILKCFLSFRKLILSFVNSGAFNMEYTPEGRSIATQYQFTGATVGITRVNQPTIQSGEFSATIMGKTKRTKLEIISSSYLPVEFQSMELSGEFSKIR
jgi:hypothetical protein